MQLTFTRFLKENNNNAALAAILPGNPVIQRFKQLFNWMPQQRFIMLQHNVLIK